MTHGESGFPVSGAKSAVSAIVVRAALSDDGDDGQKAAQESPASADECAAEARLRLVIYKVPDRHRT
jgi:hypothetical protein